MALNERQKEILTILYRDGSATVGTLCRTLYVSEMTVRRDLSEMEKGGFLRRFRGGAALKVDAGDMPITERMLVDQKEKETLAQKCRPYLDDHITVFIDSSSTCQYILPYLTEYNDVRVITNSVSALLSLERLHIPAIIIGGEYYEQDMCTVGPLAEECANGFNADVAFFTTAAISNDGVISDFDMRQTMIRKIIMRNATSSIFLFEKDKLGKKHPYTLCHRNDATAILMVEEE